MTAAEFRLEAARAEKMAANTRRQRADFTYNVKHDRAVALDMLRQEVDHLLKAIEYHARANQLERTDRKTA